MGPRDKLRGAFWSAPAERSGDGALALGPPLAPRAKAESRFACLRTPNRGRLDGICCPSDGLRSFILSLFVFLFAVRRFAPGSQKTFQVPRSECDQRNLVRVFG